MANVTFPSNGTTMSGYLATPPSGKGPGVIVIQEWWGLNDQIKGVADLFAREGFVALAPDFYRGVVTAEPSEAQKAMMEFLQANTAARDTKAAARFLTSQPSVTSARVGVIGFCMGGFLALVSASAAPDKIAAAVDCYGAGKDLPDLGPAKGIPVMGVFGGQDHSIPPEKIAELESAARAAGVPFTKHLYPDAGHAFLNEQRAAVYRADDARDAWGKIMPFLKQHVR